MNSASVIVLCLIKRRKYLQFSSSLFRFNQFILVYSKINKTFEEGFYREKDFVSLHPHSLIFVLYIKQLPHTMYPTDLLLWWAMIAAFLDQVPWLLLTMTRCHDCYLQWSGAMIVTYNDQVPWLLLTMTRCHDCYLQWPGAMIVTSNDQVKWFLLPMIRCHDCHYNDRLPWLLLTMTRCRDCYLQWPGAKVVNYNDQVPWHSYLQWPGAMVVIYNDQVPW